MSKNPGKLCHSIPENLIPTKWVKTLSGEYINLDMCSEITVDGPYSDKEGYRVYQVMAMSINNHYELFRGSKEECDRFVEELVG